MAFNLQDMKNVEEYYKKTYKINYKNLLDTIESVQYFLDDSESDKQNKSDTIDSFYYFDPKDDYYTAEKVAKLIKQAAGPLPEGDIYKQASEKYNNIMNDPNWENQLNFGQVLATEQYNRNKFNEIVKELIGKVDGVDNTMYMCEVFKDAAQLLGNDPKIFNLRERDANGDCDGILEESA
jgi:hypothetical protein